jgi:hypothetical protein
MPRGRGRGGYQAPASPAPVSGPGALSARTDGGAGQPVRIAAGGDFGDRQQMQQLQSSAPLASTGPLTDTPSPSGPPPGSLTPLTAPTDRPDEPLTHGLPVGPGGGPEVLGLGSPATMGSLLDSLAQTSPAVAQLAAYVQSGRA